VIDSARNMQNADQIENVERANNEIHELALQPIFEEAEGENDASYDSLNGGLRDEPDPERQGEQTGSQARSGAARTLAARHATSLNRDSHLGRLIDESASQAREYRPQTRNSRAQQSYLLHQERRGNSVNYLQTHMPFSRTTTSPPNPFLP